ncbi:MAG: uracil-DNA glycosylase [Holosporaceae bacterium]|jgi:DNA polymerase|nr:uracil-DNA glycosylase [Holosporaceae bacterium]
MTPSQLKQVAEWFAAAGVSDITADKNSLHSGEKKEAGTLEELKAAIMRIDIPLKDCALNTVFGVGDPNADILLLGEAPGAEEDRQGIPFVGQSGQLLDKILAAVGLDRSRIYITNILPWRPPGNRTPTNQEMELFRPYVIRHISLVNPKIVVCLGGTATKALLQTSQGIMQLRGRWTQMAELSAKILPTFHPAYLLRSPSQKREAWADFLNVTQAVDQTS